VAQERNYYQRRDCGELHDACHNTTDNGAQFTAVVSNTAGSVTSSAATLTVNAATARSL